MMKLISAVLLCILLHYTAWTQTQTPVYLSQTITNANCRGFYRYLPKDYSTTTKSYPLIIWVHGAGQFGQGNSTDLPKVLEWGVPKIISEGGFPESFRVNGGDYSFIIISPQFMGWPSAVNLAGIISYVSNNYRVDADRIYLMGISAGGGGVWDYASASVANSDKLAAIIPFCGTTNPTKTLAGRIAASKLPVWAFHNTHDGTVPVAYSRNWVNYINTYVPDPSPAAKLTEFPVQSNDAVIAHECWSLATLPTYKPQGINIYEWLLQYKRRIAVVNAAPVARAGNDISFVLPATLTLSGTESTDADGMIAVYRWRKVNGPATCSFSDSTAATTIVSNLSPGTYQFELQVTDNGGATATDNITATVYAPIEPGTIQRVLVDIGAGTLTSVSNGLYWNNLRDGRPGVRISNAVTTLNLPSGIKLEVVNRLDGTYNTSSTGLGTGNTTGVIKDYPASATSDYQMIHSSATNGLWRISGMDASKVYTIKFWGSRTGTTASRTAEIKRADETIWKSYTATSNTNYDNAAVFIISGKTTMDFNIRTKSGSDFSALSVLDISFGGGSTPAVPNDPPVADAGADQLVYLPPNTATLNGSASFDPDGIISAWKWRKISGSAMEFSNDAIANPSVGSLTYGVYLFELMVTDSSGATAKDTIVLTVNNPVVANAGPDEVLTLPVDTATVSGAASTDVDNSITSYSWTQVSGPAANIISPSSVQTLITFPAADTYRFELTVTNSGGTSAKDSVDIIVSPVPNVLPVANAGADTLIHLPPNTTALDGSASFDSDGTIVAWKWRKISGPAMSFSNSSIANPSVNSLTYGVYSFELMVTDDRGDTGKDTMVLTVNNPPVANAGSDAGIILPVNSVTLSGAASGDADGSIQSYSWMQISGMAANITSPSSVQTLATFTAAGTYQFELTVTDNRGIAAKDFVTITVSPEIPPALTKSLRVNVFGGTNPYNNAQWNNLNLAGSLTSTKFKYDDGTASNINAVITASALISDNGATYATATTACPPQVLRYSSANTSYRTLTFNGLTNSKTYSLEFYASRGNTGNKSTYQIGNKIDTISTDNNLNDVARFANIIPDNNGRIAVIINRIGTWNYLSGFVITENAETSVNMISSRSVTEPASMAAMTEKPETESATLVLYPNPGSDIIYLNMPAGVSGPYRLNLVNLNGRTVLQKTGTKRSGGLSDQINIRDLPKGMYLLKLWIQDKTVRSTIIKL
jgi:hypothetical protein